MLVKGGSRGSLFYIIKVIIIYLFRILSFRIIECKMNVRFQHNAYEHIVWPSMCLVFRVHLKSLTSDNL